MRFSFRAGTLRSLSVLAWFGFLACVGNFWLGLEGVAFVCIASTSWVRGYFYSQERIAVVNWEAVEKAWLWSNVVWWQDHKHSTWLFKDEVGPACWAQLNRGLRLHMPNHAVGLSMSR